MSEVKPLYSATKEWVISSNTDPSLDEIKNAAIKQCFGRNILVGKLTWKVKYYPNGSSKTHAGNSSIFIYMLSKPPNIATLSIKCKISWCQFNKSIERRKIIKSTDCIIMKGNCKFIQLSKLKINKLTMRISITVFQMYDAKGEIVIVNGNKPSKQKKIAATASMEMHRKKMQFIAKKVQQFDLSRLPEYYSKYFECDIKSVFNGKLKKLIMHFSDIFVIKTKSSHTVVISKLYQEQKNDDSKVNDDTQKNQNEANLELILRKYYALKEDYSCAMKLVGYLQKRNFELHDETKNNSNDIGECIVCMDHKRSHVCIPCGHLSLCAKCKELINEKCPICQADCIVYKIYK